MTAKRVFALATVVAAAAFSAPAQTRELNPTVKVLARPQSAVPAECATDPSIVPALEAEAAEPAAAPAPPSSDLRTTLRRLQVAAEVNDYAVFKSELAEARRAAASHPAGGERNAANDALQVFADIGRVWDYAMASPTGAFFDSTAQGGSLLNAMKRYPDYGRAIADQTFTSGGQTLYPTSETRRFLTRESARRLTRLGVSTPARVARGAQPEPPPRRTVVATPPPARKPVQIAAKATPKKTSPKKTASTPPVPKKTVANATPPKSPAINATPPPTPKPKPAAPPKVAKTSTMPLGPPIVATPQPKAPATTTTQTAATTTTAPPSAATSTTDTTVSTATSSPTDTSVTPAPDTATTATSVPAEKQNGNMNLILAVVLILVGIGVLVVLFRASD
jgi:hypothetical protein